MDAHYKAQGVFNERTEKKRKCLICKKSFFPKDGRSTCSNACIEEVSRSNRERIQEKKEEKDDLSTEAKRWLEKKGNRLFRSSSLLQVEELRK